jgi:hypothetical protein
MWTFPYNYRFGRATLTPVKCVTPATSTPTATPTLTHAVTAEPTFTQAPAATGTATASPTITNTRVPPTIDPARFTRTPTETLTPSVTVTLTPTSTATITQTPTLTPAITINTIGNASPYPATTNVTGLTGTITKVTVQLTNFNHTFPDDVAMLLANGNGQKVILMADSGGGSGGACPVSGLSILFDDVGVAMPDSCSLTSGTYRPTVGTLAGPEGVAFGGTFPAPAPAPAYATTLAAFNGTSPNVSWDLYVFDDASSDGGSIGTWSLCIATTTGGAC